MAKVKKIFSIDKKIFGFFVFKLTFFLIGFQPIIKKPISKTTK